LRQPFSLLLAARSLVSRPHFQSTGRIFENASELKWMHEGRDAREARQAVSLAALRRCINTLCNT
jgi:hypothetical protein